jgi:hypothetical protein
VVGFSSGLYIPVVVAASAIVQYLQDNQQAIVDVTLVAIDHLGIM